MFNLFCSVPVTVTEAALGAEILVPRLEEKLSLKIPAGTQGGQQFRLRGRGVPLAGGTRRGDLYVSVEVVIPEARDPRARRLFRELEKLFPDNPRVGT
jgi:DnaJ-class molecular chaperone